MSRPTDDDIREAVASTLDEIEGLHSHAFVPDQIHPPAGVVIEVDVRFDAAMQGGSDEFLVLYRLMTGLADLRTAQKSLSEFVYQVRDRIDEAPELGGVAADSRVRRKRGDSEGQLTIGEEKFAVVDIEIEIYT